jgi:hypothetical protein
MLFSSFKLFEDELAERNDGGPPIAESLQDRDLDVAKSDGLKSENGYYASVEELLS